MSIGRYFRAYLVGGMLAAVGLSACRSTYQGERAEPSGFLGDYSQLQKSDKVKALLFYYDPQADFSRYTKIMLDPVRIYAGEDGRLGQLPGTEATNLVNYMDATLRRHLSNDYTFVTTPGPDVLRLRVALTHPKSSPVVRDIISTVLPYSVAFSALKKVTTGSNLAVGSAGMEAEGLDSLTGKRLFATLDLQIGRKVTWKFNKLEAWHAVQDACDFWAERFQDRLHRARLRNKS